MRLILALLVIIGTVPAIACDDDSPFAHFTQKKHVTVCSPPDVWGNVVCTEQ